MLWHITRTILVLFHKYYPLYMSCKVCDVPRGVDNNTICHHYQIFPQFFSLPRDFPVYFVTQSAEVAVCSVKIQSSILISIITTSIMWRLTRNTFSRAWGCQNVFCKTKVCVWIWRKRNENKFTLGFFNALYTCTQIDGLSQTQALRAFNTLNSLMWDVEQEIKVTFCYACCACIV